ncbi:MAG: glutamate-5-semialdehyde dehydrogenase [Candidatus Omnitrophota bacterium]|nr:glutamate-5-semialdehyde dehydrogenase [Candidatus Omnitrophota bacterium]
MDLSKEIIGLCKKAKSASRKLALVSTSDKNAALECMAVALLKNSDFLIRENKKDLALAQKKKLSPAIKDRLTLTEKRIQQMANALTIVAKLKDPIGEVIKSWQRPNGLLISKIRVPIGVIGIIYESRPEVTSDCIGLCLKSGNAVILKGGSEAINSNLAIFKVLSNCLKETIIPCGAFNLVASIDRKAVNVLLKQNTLVDLIIPRGGEGLIREVAGKSRIPVIKHYKGICHVYVDSEADLNIAHKVCFNAKVQRPGVCNAMETLLVNYDVAARFLPGMIKDYQKSGVEIRGCLVTRKISKGIKAAIEKDWSTEYLDLILSVKVVRDLTEAITHINKYGSQHSDAIITDDERHAERFLREVDSACVYVNASTRFTDGYEFGMGAEIGISTDKLHCRGPMALEELSTYKYTIHGSGQIRE